MKLSLVFLIVAMMSALPGVGLSEESRQDVPGVAGPGAAFYGYLTPVISISKGDSLTFTNLDVQRHNIVHDVEADGEGGKPNVRWCKSAKGGHEHGDEHLCPLFWSKLVGFQGSTPVKGLKRVKAGESYTFFCTLHHGMKGTLVVQP